MNIYEYFSPDIPETPKPTKQVGNLYSRLFTFEIVYFILLDPCGSAP